MRKDFITNQKYSSTDEVSFVEDFWTDVWERQGGPQKSPVKISKKEEYILISNYLKELKKGAAILDGGCGLGDWVIALRSKGFDTIGIDISKKTIGNLKNLFSEELFIHGDIRDTTLESNRFDAYYSWGVFEHFESGPQKCLKEAMRVLKPGGFLFISVPMDNLRLSILEIFRFRIKNYSSKKSFYQYRFSKNELANELNQSGFDIISINPIHKRQGIMRCLHHEFGFNYDWLLTKGLAVCLAPITPGWLIAHMVLAIARKPY